MTIPKSRSINYDKPVSRCQMNSSIFSNLTTEDSNEGPTQSSWPETCYAERHSTPTSPSYETLSACGNSSDCEELSRLESLPTELVQKVAFELASDLDISNLSLASPVLADVLNSNKADFWRKRFLIRYDYPLHVENYTDFAMAYKLRRFVLRRIDGIALQNGQKAKAMHQMLVVLDLVLETYNRPKNESSPLKRSKNLAALSSPGTSRWIVDFLSCALFGCQKAKYGRPNMLFDSLQIVLSHLVLHPTSPISLHLSSSRENYDLTRVYNYNKPFSTIFQEVDDPRPVAKVRLFPNLTRQRKKLHRVDLHALLHIRNFWQRHFLDDQHNGPIQGIGENTYASMMKSLVSLGRIPRMWETSLLEETPVHKKWIGHYSCVHPWPKNRQDLEERQSCAEDWGKIDPMTLDLEIDTENTDLAYWPPLFSKIPAFERTFPKEKRRQALNLNYLRGTTSFLDLGGGEKSRHVAQLSDELAADLPKWHPFLAWRVHGFLHDIDSEDLQGRKLGREKFSGSKGSFPERVIPGWKRIVMVMYQSSDRQLLSILEHAQEDYGGNDINFDTSDIWVNPESQATSPQDQTSSTVATTNDGMVQAATAAATNNESDATSADPSEEEIGLAVKKLLVTRLKTFSESYTALLAEHSEPPPSLPCSAPMAGQRIKVKESPLPLFSAKHIHQMEEAHSPVQYMQWNDGTVEYAYAYEGVIIPGGKIMLGRWWRMHGVGGMGPGKEVDPDGKGIEIRPVVPPAMENGNGHGHNTRDTTRQSGKRKKAQAVRKSKRKCVRTKGKMKSKKRIHDSTTEEEGWNSESSDGDVGNEGQESKDIEYEFVTMLNGQESRAVNAVKGLERGPFVFWTD